LPHCFENTRSGGYFRALAARWFATLAAAALFLTLFI
jgi:hypothetical protein